MEHDILRKIKISKREAWEELSIIFSKDDNDNKIIS